MKKVEGYTLIEILIVLLIISIVTGMALLTISHNVNKQLEIVASELVQTMTLAEEQAILQPSVLGLSLSKHSWQFSSLQPYADGKKNRWAPLHDAMLGEKNIPDAIQLDVNVGEQRVASSQDETPHPQIIISTNGDITPFTIYIGQKGKKPRYAITGDADGHVTSQLLS